MGLIIMSMMEGLLDVSFYSIFVKQSARKLLVMVLILFFLSCRYDGISRSMDASDSAAVLLG